MRICFSYKWFLSHWFKIHDICRCSTSGHVVDLWTCFHFCKATSWSHMCTSHTNGISYVRHTQTGSNMCSLYTNGVSYMFVISKRGLICLRHTKNGFHKCLLYILRAFVCSLYIYVDSSVFVIHKRPRICVLYT